MLFVFVSVYFIFLLLFILFPLFLSVKWTYCCGKTEKSNLTIKLLQRYIHWSVRLMLITTLSIYDSSLNNIIISLESQIFISDLCFYLSRSFLVILKSKIQRIITGRNELCWLFLQFLDFSPPNIHNNKTENHYSHTLQVIKIIIIKNKNNK